MINKKVMEIELSADNQNFDDYYYADIQLPAEDYEIRDALQRVRGVGRDENDLDISILNCELLLQLDNVRIDGLTIKELNFFARRLAELSNDEIMMFQAVAPRFLPDEGDLIAMKDLINLTYGLDGVSVIPNVYSDEQLGEFVIDNDLNEDIAAIPEASLYLLDKAQIGKLQRKNDGGIFVGNNYVVAGEYELPKVYDGVTLPETDNTEEYAFCLQIAEAPMNDSEETADSAEWISLPIERAEADRIAQMHNERDITDCVYYGFESAIPQIESEMFGDMADFDKLNSLSSHISLLSPTDQVKFKAVLEAEHPKGLNEVADIADNLWKYELTSSPSNSDQFFKQYLAHHLDSRFDSEWLDTLLTGNEGNRLLSRLGATATDYGIISARRLSLYELVPYNQPEAVKELSTQSMTDEKLEVIEILDRVALFSNGRIADNEVPDGLYKYDLRQSDDGDTFVTVEPCVKVNHGGTILLKEALDFNEDTYDFGENVYLTLNDDTSPNFTGELMTAEEFMNTDFTEEQDGGMTLE